MFDIYVSSHRMFNIMSIYALEAAWNDGFPIVNRTGFPVFLQVAHFMHCLKLGTKFHEEHAV